MCARGGNRGQQSPYAVCHKALQRPCSMTSESSSSGSSFGFSLHGKDMGGEGSPQSKGESLRVCVVWVQLQLPERFCRGAQRQSV